MAKCAEKKDADDLLRTEKPRIWNPSKFTKVARMFGRLKETNGFRFAYPLPSLGDIQRHFA
jgi:hypothetical protein